MGARVLVDGNSINTMKLLAVCCVREVGEGEEVGGSERWECGGENLGLGMGMGMGMAYAT